MPFVNLSRHQWSAIRAFTAKGWTPQISSLPNVDFINKETGQKVTRTVDELVQQYDSDQKDGKRQRSINKNTQQYIAKGFYVRN